MKGKLASRYPSTEGEYTDLRVLRSAAGWYIGTNFIHNGTALGIPKGFIEPGSRESGYYATREEAERALKSESWEQRGHP